MYRIDKFLDELFKSDKCIDFLETAPMKKEGWDILNLKGGVVGTGKKTMVKIREYAQKLQSKDNIRVQKWDLRYSIDNDGKYAKQIKHEILVYDSYGKKFLEMYFSKIKKNDNDPPIYSEDIYYKNKK